MQNTMIRRIALVSGRAFMGAVTLASVAQAGEGGIAGSAAFTVNGTNVTGVAVSAAVGKENAAAAAFNYNGTNAGGLQNSAFAIGSAGTLTMTTIGDPSGFGIDAVEDTDRTTPQTNTFSAGTVGIQIGTTSGNAVVNSPAVESPQ